MKHYEIFAFLLYVIPDNTIIPDALGTGCWKPNISRHYPYFLRLCLTVVRDGIPITVLINHFALYKARSPIWHLHQNTLARFSWVQNSKVRICTSIKWWWNTSDFQTRGKKGDCTTMHESALYQPHIYKWPLCKHRGYNLLEVPTRITCVTYKNMESWALSHISGVTFCMRVGEDVFPKLVYFY